LIAAEINRRLGNFAHDRGAGFVLQSDCGYQCFPTDPRKVRLPDGSFVCAGRLTLADLEQGDLFALVDFVDRPTATADE
jgi:hypothetical protein